MSLLSASHFVQFNPALLLPEEHQAVDVAHEETLFGILETVTSVQCQFSDLATSTEDLIRRFGGIKQATSMMRVTEPQAMSQLVAITALEMLTVGTIKPVLGDRKDTLELRKTIRGIALSNWQNRTAPST